MSHGIRPFIVTKVFSWTPSIRTVTKHGKIIDDSKNDKNACLLKVFLIVLNSWHADRAAKVYNRNKCLLLLLIIQDGAIVVVVPCHLVIGSCVVNKYAKCTTVNMDPFTPEERINIREY